MSLAQGASLSFSNHCVPKMAVAQEKRFDGGWGKGFAEGGCGG